MSFRSRIMENRTFALRLVSEAVHLDSSGFSQASFEKYLHSLQALTVYLNDMFKSLGFSKMMEKVREIKHVLSMVHECSDRVAAITDRTVQPNISNKIVQTKGSSSVFNSSLRSSKTSKLLGIEKLQNENMTLLKTFQWRFERARDAYTRTNLKLELERRLTENDHLVKKKFDLAVRQLQKERVNMMEMEMKKLFENQRLNENEKEKRDLYLSVLEYTKKETWPCTWKLNPYEFSDLDSTSKVFHKTIRCSDHPLSQWLTMVQTNIKREIDTTLRHYHHFQKLLPDMSCNSDENSYHMSEVPDEYIFSKESDSEKPSIAKHNLSTLDKALANISSDIMCSISSVVHIFYLAYKSLLPDDAEEICLCLIESYVLKPIWPNLMTLYRIVNIAPEHKIMEIMHNYCDSKPEDFGLMKQLNFNLCEQCISHLKMLPYTHSLTEKLKILVKVSQLLCGSFSSKESNQKTVFGADEFMPLLCYVLVKSKLPQLSSECNAIEQLFDVKFMFGEEGYALSSFLTALKYIEMKKLIDGANKEN